MKNTLSSQPAGQPVSQPSSSEELPGPFWPLVLMGLSLGTILTWNLVATLRDCYMGVRMRDQQDTAAAQAFEAEEKMKTLMFDLIALSAKNPEAKAIVDKYQIRYNAAPQAPAPAAGQTPPATPSAVPATNSPAAKPAR